LSKVDYQEVPLLELKGIQKRYEGVQAIKKLDFKVYKNEVVGLVGDNGAGKSTLIKIIAGVIPRDGGKTYWNGKQIEIASVKDARELGIETVFQEQALVDILSISSNIFLGREPTKAVGPLSIIDYARMNRESIPLLKGLGLKLDSPGKELRFCSGGEKQGVAISRAVHYRAGLIILDEPTRGLSVVGVEQVLNLVRKLKEEGCACIFITHNFQHVYAVADRFVILSRGMKFLDERKENLSLQQIEDAVVAASKGITPEVRTEL
jgi:simple sugar transport system ATP-binding protein